jgi:hypothetical protein
VEASFAPLHHASGVALERFAGAFFKALRTARDLIGLALARCIQRLDANDLDFAMVAARFCEALVDLGQAHSLPALVENFLEREIDPRPLLGRPVGRGSRAGSAIPRRERVGYGAAVTCLSPHRRSYQFRRLSRLLQS